MKIILACFLMMSGSLSWTYRYDQEGYKIGDFAAEFSLRNVDGKTVSLSDYQSSKGILIVFTSNSCPFSILYEQRIINLSITYEPQKFPLIAINPGDPGVQPADSFENMQRHSKDKIFPFPYLVDDSQEVAKAFGATLTPELFILKNIGNRFQVVYIGAIDDNPKEPNRVKRHYADEALQQILSGKEITEPESHVTGCGIKWKR